MSWMDALKSDIDSKKRGIDTVLSSSSVSTNTAAPPSKYLRKGDLDRLRAQELEQAHRASSSSPKPASALPAHLDTPSPGASSREGTPTSHLPSGAATPLAATTDDKADTFNVTATEAVRRLRAKGQPIRLFGESDKERRLRLRALELIEERSEGQQNDLMRALEKQQKGYEMAEGLGGKEAVEAAAAIKKGKGKEEANPSKEEEQEDKSLKDGTTLVDMQLVKSNPFKVYPQIYHALKKILREWEESLNDRPETVKRSTQGKIAAATQQTSSEYLKPLFKSLRKRDLAPDVLLAIAEITNNMQRREYLRANDAYLRLSIGNAPWPIGVTMVGIHERSGREKIFSNNVAHVLNDETSRKYIQSLKRLLTFAQTKYPPDDLSQMMG